MKRRWLGVVLMVLASVSSLFVYVPTVAPAAEAGTVTASITGIVRYSFNGTTNLCANTEINVTNTDGNATSFPPSTTTNADGNYTVNNITLKPGPVAGGYKMILTVDSCAGPDGKFYKGTSGPITLTPPTTYYNLILTEETTPPANGNVDCDAGALSWLICDFLIQNTLDFVDFMINSVLAPFLKEPPLSSTNPQGVNGCTNPAGCDTPLYTVWSSMRNIASIFFILIFFLVIIGTALGFDSYTVKKILPRLVAGAILVPLSWFFCAVVIDIGNVIGQGFITLTNNIIPPPKIDFGSPISGMFLGTAGIIAIGVTYVAFTSIAYGVLAGIALSILATFLTLILRKVLITLFVILSPFAVLAWVLPNTQRWYSRWWTNFFRLVMLYPYMMIFIQAGRLAASTTTSFFGNYNDLLEVPFRAASIGLHPMVGAIGQEASQGFGSLVALLILYGSPIAAIATYPKAMGEAGSALHGGMDRLRGAADDQVGQNSDLAKNLAEGRKHKAVEKAKNAEAAAKEAKLQGKSGAWHKMKAGFHWGRAGLGGPPIPNAPLPIGTRLARSKATGDAEQALGTVDAEDRQSAEGEPEAFTQRRAAAAQQILNRKLSERGARQGVLDAYSTSGLTSAQTTLATQRAARYATRDAELDKLGSNVGAVEDENLNHREGEARTGNNVTGEQRVQAARDLSAVGSAKKRGEIKGVLGGRVTAEAEIHAELAPHFAAVNTSRAAAGLPPLTAGQMAQATRDIRLRNVANAKTITATADTVAEQKTANTTITTNAELDQKTMRDSGGTITTIAQARQKRLQNLSAATGEHVREKIGLDEGHTNAALDIEHAVGRESINNLVDGGALGNREQIATQRALRQARTTIQGAGGRIGSLSDSEAYEAALEEGTDRIGASVAAQRQSLNQRDSDRARAARDGMSSADPTADNKVIAGIEAAKGRTSQASAARISAINAAQAGISASTDEYTDSALLTANTNTAAANAELRGSSGAINSRINAEAARQMAAGVPPALARQRAANIVQTQSLNATAQVAYEAGADKAVGTLNADLGKADTIRQEVGEQHLKNEIDAVQNSFGTGPRLSPEAAEARAKQNIATGATLTSRAQAASQVRAKRDEDIAASTRDSSAQDQSVERAQATGVNESLKSQIIEEGNRLRAAGLNPAQAEANVRARNISAARTQGRLAAAENARKRTDTNIGIENDLQDAVTQEEANLVAAGVGNINTAAQAAANVQQQRLSDIGLSARTSSERGARKQAETNAGVRVDVESAIADRAAELQENARLSGNPITAAQARAAAEVDIRRTSLSAIGDTAREHSSQASRKEVEDARGNQIAIETQVEEEMRDIQEKNPGISPDAARLQAEETVEKRDLDAAGFSARKDAIANSRKTSDANINTQKEFDNDVNDEIIDIQQEAIRTTGSILPPSEAQARARQIVTQRRAEATGAAAGAAALKAARTTTASEQAVVNNRDNKIAAEQAAAGTNRIQSEQTVRERNLDALGKVTEASAEMDADKGESEMLESAKALDQLVNTEADKLAGPGGVVTDAIRQEARRNVLGAAGTAAGLAAANRLTREIETNRGIENDLESQARQQQERDGSTIEEAEARVRAVRLANAGNKARTQAERAAAKERGQDAGATKDLKQRVDKQARKIMREEAKAGRTISAAAAREEAEIQVRDEDLAALATKSTEESARASRQEAKEAQGAARGLEAQIRQRAQEVAGPGNTPTQQQRDEAANFIDNQNLKKAGRAAEIAGQDKYMDTVKRDYGTVTAHKATLKQSLVERDRNAASKKAAEAVTQKAFQDAYNAAIADGKSVDEAQAAGTAAREDRAVVDEALARGKEAGEAARIAAEAAIKRGDPGYQAADQEQEAIIAQGVAAEEQAMRAANTAQATVAGLNQAVSAPNALNADERLAVATENAVANLAAESGAARARYELTRPGQSGNRSFKQIETSTVRNQRASILSALSDEARKTEIEYPVPVMEQAKNPDGTPMINDRGEPVMIPVYDDTPMTDPTTGAILYDKEGNPIPVHDENGKRIPKQIMRRDTIGKTDINNNSIPVMEKRIRELLTKPGGPENEAEAIALFETLSKTNQGRKVGIDLQEEIFGGNFEQNIDPTRLNGRAREIWEQIQDKVGIKTAPYYTIPPAALYDGFAPEAFADLGYAGKAQYFDYLNHAKKQYLYKEAARNMHETLTNAQTAKNINSDDYQTMWLFLQDKQAREALASIQSNRPGQSGLDVIRKIDEEGRNAGAPGKFSIPEADAYNKAHSLKRGDPRFKKIGDYKDVKTDTDGTPILDANHNPIFKDDVQAVQADELRTFLNSAPPSLVPPAVGKAFLNVAGTNAEYAVQLADRYNDPTEGDFRDYVDEKIKAGETLLPPKTPPADTPLGAPPTQTFPAAAVQQLTGGGGKKDQQASTLDIQTLKDATRLYSSDAGYKAAVDQAILESRSIPLPNTYRSTP